MNTKTVLTLYCLSAYCALSTWAIELIDTNLIHELDEIEIQQPVRTIDRSTTIYEIDSLAKLGSNTSSLSDFLRENTSLYFLSTGINGSISSIRQRGLASDHSLVTWHGVPINSLTEGGMDFSNLPMFLNQDIDIVQGGTGSFYGSGNFSGVINFGTKPSWRKNLTLQYQHRHVYTLDANDDQIACTISEKKYHINFSALQHTSQNEYKYYDLVQRKNNSTTHNAFQQSGLMTDVFYHPNKNHTFQFSYWSQKKDKELPALMGQTIESSQNQYDEGNKFLGSYRYQKNNTLVQFQTALQKDYLLYTDKTIPSDTQYSIYSELETSRQFNELSIYHRPKKWFRLKSGATSSINKAIVENFGSTVTENDFALYTAIDIGTKTNLISTSIRKDFYQATNSPVVYAISGVKSLIKEAVVLRANFSKKFKAPDLNDRYWIPGGNPDLKSESGYSYEFGLKGTSSKKPKLSYFLNYYYTYLNDKIVWVPQGGNYSPANYNLVKSRGIEGQLNYSKQFGKTNLGFITNYTYAKATNHNTDNPLTEGKLVRYSPEHILSCSIRASHRYFFVKPTILYTGEMHSREDNNPIGSIEDYMLVNLAIGTKIPLGDYRSILLVYRIDNLFNETYFLQRYRPMPGRYHSITVNFGLNKHE